MLDLFSELTKDLGLGSDAPATKVRRVEVTQIIRRRGPMRPARTNSELLAIEGPIVDKTQPGQLAEDLDAMADGEQPDIVPTGGARHTLLDGSPGRALGAYNFEEGEMLTEHAPVAIRPVELDASDRWGTTESDHLPSRQLPLASGRDRDAREPPRDAREGAYRPQAPRSFETLPLSPTSGSEDPTTISSGTMAESPRTSHGRSSTAGQSSYRGVPGDAAMRPTEPALEAVSDRALQQRSSMTTAPLVSASGSSAPAPQSSTRWNRVAWIGALVVVVLLFAFVVILWYSGERGPS